MLGQWNEHQRAAQLCLRKRAILIKLQYQYASIHTKIKCFNKIIVQIKNVFDSTKEFKRNSKQ